MLKSLKTSAITLGTPWDMISDPQFLKGTYGSKSLIEEEGQEVGLRTPKQSKNHPSVSRGVCGWCPLGNSTTSGFRC